MRLLSLRPLKVFAYAILLSLLSACQTSPLTSFKQLTPGMEKHDVLEIMGSPTTTDRYQDKDRWTYVFYADNVRFEKQVQFFEGTAVYVGDPVQPAVSAAEQDRMNALKDNKKELTNYVLEIEQKKQSKPQFKDVDASPTESR